MLRPARPDEFQWIADLIHRAFAGYSARLDTERGPRKRSSKDWVADAIDAGSVHVFEADGEPIGAAVLSMTETRLYIDQIAIAPERQNDGHGQALMRAIEDFARTKGQTAIDLHTAQPMTELVSFYSRAGYRVADVGPHPNNPDGILRVFFTKTLN